ncbi:MAG TPA: histone deacetylase family protein [Usitatibacter sp.]|nr:histone deacetylase family protein [Usitatibacter sp.]
MTCAYITHASCLRHDMGPDHPECPERLDAISDYLLSSGLMGLLVPYDAPAATVEQLCRAHTSLYVHELMARSPQVGYVQVDPDTAMNSHTLDAALHAAGAAVLATDLVLDGEVTRAFCAVRPPGHHATREAAMGFCFFNNVAVGIRHALDVRGVKRVALVDFDVHHGNGSEDILANDERVLMASTFQRGLYPFLGDEPMGPNMANVGLPPGSTGEALRAAFHEVWKPRLEAFAPELIYVSAGFDAHRADGMANLRWVEKDYEWVTGELVAIAERHCKGRIVSTLEGGYDLFALSHSVAAHVRALLGT